MIFYGAFAVGKYTVAREFHKQTNYKFFHNHLSYNVARELFERDNIHIDRLVERIRLSVVREIAEAKIDVVMTHAYSTSYVSRTGLSDPAFF